MKKKILFISFILTSLVVNADPCTQTCYEYGKKYKHVYTWPNPDPSGDGPCGDPKKGTKVSWKMYIKNDEGIYIQYGKAVDIDESNMHC
ncbi:hypothetical protein AAEO56_17730 [Flavobacterium sp. DGU11]|uniref:Secreted protein n=1 Tax=Flavobacterium arundinis TaxID=3139143 RepID=A0ABU9I123_9FLAO